MKTSILYLVLASIVGFTACSDDSMAGIRRRRRPCWPCCPIIVECRRQAVVTAETQEPEDQELRTLLEARRHTLKKFLRLVEAENEIGTQWVSGQSKRGLQQTIAEVFEAELTCARTPEERIACFDGALKFQQRIEQEAAARFEAGTVHRLELLMATAERMKAEIELYNEKHGDWPASAKVQNLAGCEFTFNIDRAASREARRDTLNEAEKIIRSEFEVGRRTRSDLLSANLLVLEAELDLAKHQNERIAIIEKMLESLFGFEQTLQNRWDNGILRESDLLLAKAARATAAINLHQARTGKWPLSSGLDRASHWGIRPTEDPVLHSLLLGRRDDLKKLVSVVEAEAQKGAVKLVDVINANNAFLDAEMTLAKSPQEQVALYQEALKTQMKVEEEAIDRHEFGVVTALEVLQARAARLKVEIELHKASKETK